MEVRYDNEIYTLERVYDTTNDSNNGCNHIDNLPGTAKYMGDEIYEKIQKEAK